jgi:hypothetical protein
MNQTLKPFVVLASLALSGCYKIVLTDGGAHPFNMDNPEFHHIGVLGLVEFAEPIPVHHICPNGFARIDVQQDVITAILGAATSNLYSPTQTFVQCKSGSAFILGLDEAGAVAEAMHLEPDTTGLPGET